MPLGLQAGRSVLPPGELVVELTLTLLIGSCVSVVVLGLWMLRAVRPRAAFVHRER
jgi:hypothetical protein